jgi:hypothetical protein
MCNLELKALYISTQHSSSYYRTPLNGYEKEWALVQNGIEILGKAPSAYTEIQIPKDLSRQFVKKNCSSFESSLKI